MTRMQKMFRATQLLEENYAAALVAHLQQQGGVVYQEVATVGGHRADIVVDHKGDAADGGLEVIETKNSTSLALLMQALFWRTYASRVSIATPIGIDARVWPAVAPCIERFGFGVYRISTFNGRDFKIRQQVAPERRAADEARLRRLLHVEQQTMAPAGNADGRFVTQWRVTVLSLVKLVAAEGELPLISAIKKIEHHYGSTHSALQCLRRQIRRGDIPELELHRAHGSTNVRMRAPAVDLIFGGFEI